MTLTELARIAEEGRSAAWSDRLGRRQVHNPCESNSIMNYPRKWKP